MLTFILFALLVLSACGFAAWSFFAPPAGMHRGTREQFKIQAEQRAEREAEYAQAIVRADLYAAGVRADWVMVEN